MADNITKIASEYDMVSIMQDIGASYFGSDLSTQRVGMFGFLTESMAHMFGATVLDSSIRANEYNVATAQRMETLLYEAYLLGLDVENAKPTTMSVYLGIKTDNIIKPSHEGGFATRTGDKEHPTCTLVLEKDAVINIANYEFMFEYDIEIKAVWSNTTNRYVYSVRYLTEGDIDETSLIGKYIYPKANTLTTLSNNYIQSYLTTKNNINLLLFKVDLKQISKNTQYHSIIKNDIISLTGIDFLYNGVISHFNIYYKPNGRDEWLYIKPVSIYDTKQYDEKSVNYEIIHNESRLRLNFNNFIPDYNSEFRIDIYTTLGSEPNGLKYEGNGDDISIELYSLDERHSYAGLDLACVPISTKSDGKDLENIESLRDRIIRFKSSLNSLDTETDLYNFMRNNDTINDYVFIKKRADVIERIYSLFSIPRMANMDIIPSSTMNIAVPINDNNIDLGYDYDNDNELSSITIKAGTPMITRNSANSELLGNNKFYEDISNKVYSYYNNEKDTFLVNNILIPVSTKPDNNKDEIIGLEKNIKVFGLPYTITYDVDEKLVSFYETSISKDISTTMIAEDESTNINFAIDHFSIERNASRGDNSYTITVSVMPNGDATKSLLISEDGTNILTDVIMLKGFTYNDDNTINGFFDLDLISYSDDIYIFKGNIESMDNFNSESHYVGTSSISSMSSLSTTDDVVINGSYHFGIPNNKNHNIKVFNTKIGIGVYYLDEYDPIKHSLTNILNNVKGTDKVGIIYTESNSEKKPVITSFDGLGNYPKFALKTHPVKVKEDIIFLEYSLKNVYINNESIDLYTNMSEFMRSKSDLKDNLLVLEDIPVIQYSKCIDKDISNRIIDIISNTHEVLDELKGKITNNFSIDYKFFRTYGPSRYFKLVKPSGKDSKDLSSLDITMKFNILIRNGLSVSDSEVISQLKAHIKQFVEKLNENTNDYTIYISNVLSEIEQKYSDFIKYIELVSINGEDDSYRIINYDLPEEVKTGNISNSNLQKYIPEYINVPLENITIDITRSKY